MKNFKIISALSILALFLFADKVCAYPVPTFSPSEIAQETLTYVSQSEMYKKQIEETNNLVKKGVLAGVPGYLKSAVSGDWSGLVQNAANDGYNIYKLDHEKKKKAKEEAQEKADEQAQQKLENKQEGEQAAKEAIDENREAAAENKKSKTKKWLSLRKKAAGSAGSWVNSNREGLNKIVHGALGDSQASSAMNKALSTLGKQADNNNAEKSEKNNNNTAGDDNSKKSEDGKS